MSIKKMKYTKPILALFLTTLLLLIPILAHPGRTDAKGGHWNRKEGTYHFHTGEYAGQGSSDSSYVYEYENLTATYDTPTENLYRSNNQKGENPHSVIIIWAISFVVCLLWGKFGKEVRDTKYKVLFALAWPIIIVSLYLWLFE